jgi:hypothetical protein
MLGDKLIKESLNNMIREQWLEEATSLLDSEVFNTVGYRIPDDVKVSCGWPVSGGASSRQATIGQCFSRAVSSNNVNEIFISPKLDDAIEVLSVLAHEHIHAIDDCASGHKGLFRTIAKKIGLEGKMTATTSSEALKVKLEAIVNKIGVYPHAKLDYTKQIKKQSTRMLKVECSECGFSYRTSRKNIELMSNNTCNSCGDLTLEIV